MAELAILHFTHRICNYYWYYLLSAMYFGMMNLFIFPQPAISQNGSLAGENRSSHADLLKQQSKKSVFRLNMGKNFLNIRYFSHFVKAHANIPN